MALRQFPKIYGGILLRKSQRPLDYYRHQRSVLGWSSSIDGAGEFIGSSNVNPQGIAGIGAIAAAGAP